MKFLVSVDRAAPYELEAATSFEAVDRACAAHPAAERVDVKPARTRAPLFTASGPGLLSQCAAAGRIAMQLDEQTQRAGFGRVGNSDEYVQVMTDEEAKACITEWRERYPHIAQAWAEKLPQTWPADLTPLDRFASTNYRKD